MTLLVLHCRFLHAGAPEVEQERQARTRIGVRAQRIRSPYPPAVPPVYLFLDSSSSLFILHTAS